MAAESGVPDPEVNGLSAGPAVTQGPTKLASHFPHELSLSSRAVHADDYINTHQAVAPPLHVSTTFRYPSDPVQLTPLSNFSPATPYDSHIYSRESAPNTTRLEAILTSLLGGPALTYASGLAAFHALLVFLNPRRVALAGGYHGCYGVLALLAKLTGLQAVGLDAAGLAALQPGDVVHVETPVNPTGEARDLERLARDARARGCYLTVDATFGPPPLQDPFHHGADVVLHSGTKYFGGHSDMLCGVLAVRPERAATGPEGQPGWLAGLREERVFLGSVMGSLEGWLGVRSLRTLELRVLRQSKNTDRLIAWLVSELERGNSAVGELVGTVQHASLQPEAREENSWLRRQMPRGFGPVFSLSMKDPEDAKRLPSKLHLFHHATSLGGVESLIEWRAMSDKTVDKRLLRVSVGVEGFKDLKQDLLQGLKALMAEKPWRT